MLPIWFVPALSRGLHVVHELVCTCFRKDIGGAKGGGGTLIPVRRTYGLNPKHLKTKT